MIQRIRTALKRMKNLQRNQSDSEAKNIRHLNTDELEAGLEEALTSPTDEGIVNLIVCRPDVGQRKVLQSAEFSLEIGLVGDNWSKKPYSKSPDGGPHPEMQVTMINSRVLDLITAGDSSRMAVPGDQLVVDFDLSRENIPPGTKLNIGSAIIEVTEAPHTGCAQFVGWFGADAMRFVNSSRGRELCLRGINSKVVQPGVISQGDKITKG
ncbi:MAG: MOSC domain-containing protein [Actinomycetota bacterium]|nr:MOSC domain-containing protein [Actinomycetota bacterium]|tara:strand:+ start:2492 stop:3121 length:630 start_codon:yes stop_codon:yes gene_type:complete